MAVLFDWCGGYSGTTQATIIISFVRSHVPVLVGGSEVLVAHCPGSILQISEMDPHRAKYLGITVTISSAPLTTGPHTMGQTFHNSDRSVELSLLAANERVIPC